MKPYFLSFFLISSITYAADPKDPYAPPASVFSFSYEEFKELLSNSFNKIKAKLENFISPIFSASSIECAAGPKILPKAAPLFRQEAVIDLIPPLFSMPSINCAAQPQALPKSAPLFHREAIIDLKKGFSKAEEARKDALGCDHVTLICPTFITPQGKEFNFKKALRLLPQSMTSLKIKAHFFPLPLPPSLLKELERFQLLRHLSLPLSYRDKGKIINLSHIPLKSLEMIESHEVDLRLPFTLENLAFKESEPFPEDKMVKIVKSLKKAPSRLRHLQSLKYKTYGSGGLSREHLTDVLASFVRTLDRRAPAYRSINLLDFYLDCIEFSPFEKFFEKNRSLHHLSLGGHHAPPPSTEADNKKVLLTLLRNLESLSLTNYEGLPRLFQEVENLEDLRVHHLAFKEKKCPQFAIASEDIKGIFSAFQIKLKTLTLDSPCGDAPWDHSSSLLSQILTKKNHEEIEKIKALHFHTLNLNISPARYDEGLHHFLKVVFDKAPLTTFSFGTQDRTSCEKHEQWIFDTLLPQYKEENPPKAFNTLKTLEFRGAFHEEPLKKLFKNNDGKGILGNKNLARLSFVKPGKRGPQNLRELLKQFASVDAQIEAFSLSEEKAIRVLRKDLNVPDHIEISFTPYKE